MVGLSSEFPYIIAMGASTTEISCFYIEVDGHLIPVGIFKLYVCGLALF